jgi:hypothetical protein
MDPSPGSLLSPQPKTVSIKEQGLHDIKQRQSDNVNDDYVKIRITVLIQPEPDYEILSGPESMNIELPPVSIATTQPDIMHCLDPKAKSSIMELQLPPGSSDGTVGWLSSESVGLAHNAKIKAFTMVIYYLFLKQMNTPGQNKCCSICLKRHQYHMLVSSMLVKNIFPMFMQGRLMIYFVLEIMNVLGMSFVTVQPLLLHFMCLWLL